MQLIRDRRVLDEFDLSRRAAFSLVEVLVVMCILSILAAMLLPALIQARKQAQDVFCKNQMKQLGLMSFQYAGDFSQCVPNGDNNGPEYPPNVYHWNLLASYFGYWIGPGLYDLDSRRMYQVYNCPSPNIDDPGGHLPQTHEYGPNAEMMGPARIGGTTDEYPYRLDRMRYPSRVIYWGENRWYFEYRPKNPPASGDTAQFRHSCRANGTMFDGHVESRLKWCENGWGKIPHSDSLP